MDNKTFPNGFSNWAETHHEICAYITNVMDEEDPKPCSITKRYEQQGIGGMYELGEEWTDEFETKFKDVEWGTDNGLEYWLEELISFCDQKNQS